MTLIITARAKSHIVVTADGRCATIKDGVTSKTSDTLKKIFPFTDRGFAIVHHGENVISGRKVTCMVKEFLNDNMNSILTFGICQIATLFAQKYGNQIESTLRNIRDSKLCGFLFVGFGAGEDKPKVYEAYWKKQDVSNIVSEIKPFNKCDEWLVLSGAGEEYIRQHPNGPQEIQYGRENILYWEPKETKAYCDKLYQLAEETQTKRNEDKFGGHKHQLVITKSKWEWS